MQSFSLRDEKYIEVRCVSTRNFSNPRLLLILLKIKMLQKQAETDSEDGFKK